MTTIGNHLTAEELLAMPHDQPCELVAGELIMMTPVGGPHMKIAGRISSRLGPYVETHNLGIVGPEGGFVLSRNPDTVRAPDVAFVRREREDLCVEGFIEGPPDLAVEVVSPDDRMRDIKAKTKAWIEAGTLMVWVVWPDTRSVVVHRPGTAARILHENDVIIGEDILPGFQCKVGEFFGG